MKCTYQETVCYSWLSKSQFPKSWCYFVRKFCQSYLAMCPQLTRASVRADFSMLMVQHLLQLGAHRLWFCQIQTYRGEKLKTVTLWIMISPQNKPFRYDGWKQVFKETLEDITIHCILPYVMV